MNKKIQKLIFTIDEIDKDYRAWSGTEELEFSSWKDAEKHCKEESWTGYYYVVSGCLVILDNGERHYLDKQYKYNEFMKRLN